MKLQKAVNVLKKQGGIHVRKMARLGLIFCILALISFTVHSAEAVGFVVGHSDLKPTLIMPAGEIMTATPKLQWKMNWVKESNPQPSPYPQRLELTVIIYHNDRPVWESQPISGVAGQSLYELQLPAGVVGPGNGPAEDFVWQVVAQFYNGTTPGRKSVSDMKLFQIRGGCAVTMLVMKYQDGPPDPQKNHGFFKLSSVSDALLSAYSKQNPQLLLAQCRTAGNGECTARFAICPVAPASARVAEALWDAASPVTWRIEKAGHRFYKSAYIGRTGKVEVDLVGN